MYLYVQLQLKGFEPVSVVQQPEPPADTAIIRTSDYLFALPPTNASRQVSTVLGVGDLSSSVSLLAIAHGLDMVEFPVTSMPV